MMADAMAVLKVEKTAALTARSKVEKMGLMVEDSWDGPFVVLLPYWSLIPLIPFILTLPFFFIPFVNY